MDIKIKTCSEKDADAVYELSRELGYSQPEKSIAFQRLRTLLQSGNDTVLVAEHDGQIIGWLHAFVAYRLASEPFMEIGGMVVSSRFRRKGAGRLLVDPILKMAEERELKTRVRCNITRTDTHLFYERIGFVGKKTQHVFELPAGGTEEKS